MRAIVNRFARQMELWYSEHGLGMTGFDGADWAYAASRGAPTSINRGKTTTAKTGKAFAFPFVRSNAMALAA